MSAIATEGLVKHHTPEIKAALRLARWLLPALVLVAIGARCAAEPRPDAGLYIALGDSLSAGVGASEAKTKGFVPLVHASLGGGFDLLNLGHSGDTSGDLIDHGHLDDAIAEIEARNGDDRTDNDVRLVTLEIGGNDLLRIYFSLVLPGICADLESALEEPRCTEALTSALEGFEPNLADTLDRLYEADPELTVVLLTLYNPFDHLAGLGALGELSLEGMADTAFPDGLNDIIRRVGGERGAVLADVYPLFLGRSAELVSPDGIHPNDDGYRVMADAVIAALDTLD
jgi:lysophospholipase L1-like esterase